MRSGSETSGGSLFFYESVRWQQFWPFSDWKTCQSIFTIAYLNTELGSYPLKLNVVTTLTWVRLGKTQPRVTISISCEIADSILQSSCSNQITIWNFEFTSPSEDSFLIFSSSNRALQDELQKLGYTRSSVTLSAALKEKPESLVDHLGDRCTSTTSDNTRKEHAVSERVKQIKG